MSKKNQKQSKKTRPIKLQESARHYRERRHRELLEQENRRPGLRTAAVFSVLLGAAALIGLFFYTLFSAGQDGSLPEQFLYVAMLIFSGYALFCLLIFFVGFRYDAARLGKAQDAASTDSSVIRLFKDEIDLPYVVTDDSGKIIVASRAFEQIVPSGETGIGADIREICSEALDSIIRATTTDHSTDQKIGQIYQIALAAYPNALRQITTGEACIGVLKEIDAEATSPIAGDDGDRDRILSTVHEIASAALADAEKRTEIWRLCLTTLDDILTGESTDSSGSEKSDRLYEIAEKAYRTACEQENAYLYSAEKRAFASSMGRILTLAEKARFTESQIQKITLYKDLPAGEQLPKHALELLNEILSLSTLGIAAVSEKDDPAVSAALNAVRQVAKNALDSFPEGKSKPGKYADPSAFRKLLSDLSSAAGVPGAVGYHPSIRPLQNLLDSLLHAFDREKFGLYLSFVSKEIAIAAEGAKDTDDSAAGVYRLAQDLPRDISDRRARLGGDLLGSFRDAVSRLEIKQHLGISEEKNDLDEITQILYRRVSGALAAEETRNSCLSAISRLLQISENACSAPDITEEEKQITLEVEKKLNALKASLLASSPTSLSEVRSLNEKAVQAENDLLHLFADHPAYAEPPAAQTGTAQFSIDRMRILYREISTALPEHFPVSSLQIFSDFVSFASPALRNYPLYKSLSARTDACLASLVAEQPADASGLLPEVTDSAFSDRSWEVTTELLLRHIGVLALYTASDSGKAYAPIADVAEKTMDKLLARRIFREELVSEPLSLLKQNFSRGFTGDNLFETAAAHFRQQSNRREKLLYRAGYLLSFRVLQLFLQAGKTGDPVGIAESNALQILRAFASRSLQELAGNPPEETSDALISYATDLFQKAKTILADFTKTESEAGICYHIADYLIRLLPALRRHMLALNLEQFHSDVCAKILSDICRAEYTSSALARIRVLSEEILSSPSPETATFSGLSLSSFCSDTLREISGYAKADRVREMESVAAEYTGKALDAKFLWEYRQSLLLQVQSLISDMEDCLYLYSRPRFRNLCNISDLAQPLLLSSGKNQISGKIAESFPQIRNRICASAKDFLKKNSPTPSAENGKKKSGAECSVEEKLFGLLNQLASLPENTPDAEFRALYVEYASHLTFISLNADYCRRGERQLLLLKDLLKEEKKASPLPKTGAPLSRDSIADSFAAFLASAVKLAKSASGDSKNTLFSRIYALLSAAEKAIRDPADPGFRIFLSASLSHMLNLSSALPAECDPVSAPLKQYLKKCIRDAEDPVSTPTRKGLLAVASSAVSEIEGVFRIGKIGNHANNALPTELPEKGEQDFALLRLTLEKVLSLGAEMDDALLSLPQNGNANKLLPKLSGILSEIPAKDLLSKETALSDPKHLPEVQAQYTNALEKLGKIVQETSVYRHFFHSPASKSFLDEIRKIRQTVRDVETSSALPGSRPVAVTTLAAISQYAGAGSSGKIPDNRIPSVAEAACREISSIEGGDEFTERFSDIAVSALLQIVGYASAPEVRERAVAALLDLAERRILYASLLSDPIASLRKNSADVTKETVYDAAAALYRPTPKPIASFRETLRSYLLSSAFSSLISLSKGGNAARIRPICEEISRQNNALLSELRALPSGTAEHFLPAPIFTRISSLTRLYAGLAKVSEEILRGDGIDLECADMANEIRRIATDMIVTLRASSDRADGSGVEALPEQIKSSLARITTVSAPVLPVLKTLSAIRKEAELARDTLLGESGSNSDATGINTISPELTLRLRKIADYADSFTRTALQSGGTDSPTVAACSRMLRNTEALLTRLTSHLKRCAVPEFGEAVRASLCSLAEHHGATGTDTLVATFNSDGKPSGENNLRPGKQSDPSAFVPVVRGKDSTYAGHGLSVEKANLGSGKPVLIGGRRYLASSYPFRSSGKDFYLVTFHDAETALKLKERAEDENIAVAFIVLDNLEELAQFVRSDYRDAKHKIESELRAFSGDLNGILREYERDKYIFFFSQKELAHLINDRFGGILARIQNIKLGDSSMSVTVSMGISAIGETLTEKETNARAALDMALKRGGAQIAVYREAESTEERYEFFRGKQLKGLQAENRISTRVVADYLTELIRKSSDVLIMGHKTPDFDSVGSCVGIARLAMYCGKEVHIIADTRSQNFIDCTPDLLSLSEYRSIFIDGTTGLDKKGPDTLLIICDVSNTNIMENAEVARRSYNTVIIDHHIKTTDSDELQTLLTYIDPSASSASELVSEILAESLPQNTLRKEEANVMLSGIMVDTKNFTRSVGTRTFAAALYLRQNGANAETSYTYFYEATGDYKAEVVFRRNLQFCGEHNEIAITSCDTEDLADPDIAKCNLRAAASKAADKLLTVRGIHASFALYCYRYGDKSGISISGRSDGTINVQLILEAFHGGGHFDAAGATVPGQTVAEVTESLKKAIADYFKEQQVPESDEED